MNIWVESRSSRVHDPRKPVFRGGTRNRRIRHIEQLNTRSPPPRTAPQRVGNERLPRPDAQRQERPAQDLSVEAVYIAIHERLGDLRRAFEWCLKGLERRPEHGGLLERAARLGARLGEDARLAGVHERFLAHRPGNVRYPGLGVRDYPCTELPHPL